MGNEALAGRHTETQSSLEELGSLQSNLEHILDRLSSLAERTLGALPPASGRVDGGERAATPDFNAGMTGSIRRAIFQNYATATLISETVERLMQIG